MYIVIFSVFRNTGCREINILYIVIYNANFANGQNISENSNSYSVVRNTWQ